ncbi:TPA: fimbrial protein [Escherichia coli]
MKRLHKRFLLATFCALFTATLQAADVTITVNGRVVAKPCTIQTKEANVNLGDLYTRNLQQPGSASGWHNITLSLTDCPAETSAVTAIVTGSTDNTGYYKNEYWNNVTYPFPLTTNTNVLDIGDKTPMPLPLKLYITPVGAAGGVVIKAGEVIARIHMYKIATLGSGNPRNFTWNIISNNSVVMPTGGCTVDSRNVTVNLPDFPGSAEIPLGVYCSSEQKLSFYLSGATTDSARQVFANTAPDATKASGVGVSLMRNGKILATGENVSLGTVNKSKVPLGLSATYGQTGNKVSAGTVQSVIGVTFIYE